MIPPNRTRSSACLATLALAATPDMAAGQRRRPQPPDRVVSPAQRAEGRAPPRPERAPGHGLHGLSRRLEERVGGADRVRPLLRAHDVSGDQERPQLRHPAPGDRRPVERLHHRGPDGLLRDRPLAYLDRALYLEAERLAFLPTALEQAKFDTEREVVKNERRQSVDNVPYGLPKKRS